MTRVTVLRISIQSFLLWLTSRTDRVPLPTTVNTCFVVVFVCLFVCFFDGYVTASLYDCLLEVPVDDILSQVYNNVHLYTHLHTHILTQIHIPTHLQKVSPTIYYSCRFVISTFHKSYQKYFDNLLNHKKPIYSKKNNNPYKVKTTVSFAGLILHTGTEQICFKDFIYLYTHDTNTHTFIYIFFVNLVEVLILVRN